MSEDRERMGGKHRTDEPDVEAHRFKGRHLNEEHKDESEKDDDDAPDVEAHRFSTKR
jgi:hypothetical protein